MTAERGSRIRADARGGSLERRAVGLDQGDRTSVFQVDDPGWENARGYLFDESGMTLYFPVAKKYLTPPLSQYEVLILSQPKVVARGELQPATSEEDTATQLSLARAAGLEANKARYMLLDQRTQKARRTRYKLIVRDIARADALAAE
jgi:hypothetical protein